MTKQDKLISLAVEKLGTKREVSKYLGILPQTLNRYVNEGRDIPSSLSFKLIDLLTKKEVLEFWGFK